MLIYKITNTINGKIYVGKTTTTTEVRWALHVKHAIEEQRKTYFCNAIRKYGVDNFTIDILHEGINDEHELNDIEKLYICQYNCNDRRIGYNMTVGGDGGFTDDMRTKATKTRRKNGLSDEHKQALIAGRKRAGYHVTDDHKCRISKSLTEYYILHPDHLDNITNINRARAKGGRDHPMWGKSHSLQAKTKMRNAKLGKKYEEIYGHKKANELINNKRANTGRNNFNYKDIDVRLVETLIAHPRITRQELSIILSCSGPTLTKRFQQLFNIKNMQLFRKTHSDKELIAIFKDTMRELGE